MASYLLAPGETVTENPVLLNLTDSSLQPGQCLQPNTGAAPKSADGGGADAALTLQAPSSCSQNLREKHTQARARLGSRSSARRCSEVWAPFQSFTHSFGKHQEPGPWEVTGKSQSPEGLRGAAGGKPLTRSSGEGEGNQGALA